MTTDSAKKRVAKGPGKQAPQTIHKISLTPPVRAKQTHCRVPAARPHVCSGVRKQLLGFQDSETSPITVCGISVAHNLDWKSVPCLFLVSLPDGRCLH